MVLVCGRLLTEAVRSVLWIGCKWLLVGRLRTSRSASPTTMFRWRLGRLIGVELQSTFALLRGTVLLNHLLTALGAAVDRDAAVYTTDVHDWDLVQLDARATLLEESSVSGARLHPDRLVLHRAIVDALIESKAHVDAGSTVTEPLHRLQCSSAVACKGSQPREAELAGQAQRLPLCNWLAAVLGTGVCFALAELLTLLLLLGALSLLSIHISSDVLVTMYNVWTAPLWKIFCVTLVYTLSLRIIEPPVATLLLAAGRCAFVRPVRDGDASSSHSVGSIFLEQSLRSPQVVHAAQIAQLCYSTCVLRAFGLRTSSALNMFPLPKLDRPELVSVEPGAYTGGGNMLLTLSSGSGAGRYQAIHLKADTFIANGSIVAPGCSLGPRAILGNRSAIDSTGAHENGVWLGAPASLLYQSAHALRALTGHAIELRAPVRMVCIFLVFLSLLTIFPAAASVVVVAVYNSFSDAGAGAAVEYVILSCLLPWVYLSWSMLLATLAKWILVGRYREERKCEMGSNLANARDVAVELLIEAEVLAEPIKGTPLYSLLQRAQGAKVGRGVCWLGNLCPEPDMLSVGDGVLVAPSVDFFTHKCVPSPCHASGSSRLGAHLPLDTPLPCAARRTCASSLSRSGLGTAASLASAPR